MRHRVSRIGIGAWSLSVIPLWVALGVGGLAVAAGSEGSGNSAPVADSGRGAAGAAPCNYYYEWIGKTRYPLQADPHATYTYVAVSHDAARDGIGFLVRGEYIHGVFTSWLTYGRGAEPHSGVNSNFANPDQAIAPDPGSVNPFQPGQPMMGTPRNFTLLFKPNDSDQSDLAPSLAGTTAAEIATSNMKSYPPTKKDGFWVLANRDYQAFPGYNPGGSTEDTFPVVTAVELASGEAVDCQAYNLLPEKLQRPPTNPPDGLSYGRVPTRIALQNGSHFDLLGGLGGGSRVQFAPKNPPGLIQFTRALLGPGADVAQVPPPQNCAGYLATRMSTRRVSLVRIPHVANFTDTEGLSASTTFPNSVAEPWQAAFISFTMYGDSPGLYLPGKPTTSSVADHELNVDGTGGSTILVWPRNRRSLPRRERVRVFDYAAEQGWAIVRGGTAGRQTSANVLIRTKAAASDYFGHESNLPCFFDKPQNEHKAWSDIPVEVGSPWVATAENLGAAAPQGVTCRSVRALRSGRCLERLKAHIAATGGSYFAPSP